MRKWRLIPMLALCALAGCQNSSTSSEATRSASAGSLHPAYTTDPIPSQSVTLLVHGMGCPMCSNNIDKQLVAIQGVEDVRVDLGSGQIRLTLTSGQQPSPLQLAQAVSKSGYTLIAISTP